MAYEFGEHFQSDMWWYESKIFLKCGENYIIYDRKVYPSMLFCIYTVVFYNLLTVV